MDKIEEIAKILADMSLNTTDDIEDFTIFWRGYAKQIADLFPKGDEDGLLTDEALMALAHCEKTQLCNLCGAGCYNIAKAQQALTIRLENEKHKPPEGVLLTEEELKQEYYDRKMLISIHADIPKLYKPYIDVAKELQATKAIAYTEAERKKEITELRHKYEIEREASNYALSKTEQLNKKHQEKIVEIFELADELAAYMLLIKEELDKRSITIRRPWVKIVDPVYINGLAKKVEEYQTLKEKHTGGS